MKTTAPVDDVYRVIYNDHYDPFRVLGIHRIELEGKNAVVVRSFLPAAGRVWVIEEQNGTTREHPMNRLHDEGFFEVVVPGRQDVFPYKLKMETLRETVETFHDSYSFLPTLTEFDIYLFNAGDHHRIYEKLGAHFASVNGIGGIQFAVWAPGARSVSVIGDFNGWDRRSHAMRVLGTSGVWEIFIPGLPEGALYKFQVKTQQGFILDKTDPYGFEMEVRPRTASRVNLLGNFAWHDQEWIERRRSVDPLALPMSVYEVHPGSWQRNDDGSWLSYRELAHRLVEYVQHAGFTHIELMPVMEHPFDASWGYQVTGYFAPTARFGSPQDFMYFVDHCHQHDIGVILDWVPAHFPKDNHALADFDGTHLYEHADPRKGEHQDWGTLIFNYGRNEVRNFLLSNALFWMDKYHIDGIRIDAVASMLYLDYSRKGGEWVPNQYGGRENIEAVEFLKHMNRVVHDYYPGVLTIAEESTAWPGVTTPLEYHGLGFDLKWNMGWMHDMLEYFSRDPVFRRHHQDNLTFALLYAFSERFMLPLSHDEVVHGKQSLLSKMPGDWWQQFANLRVLYGLMHGFPGKKLLFMGCEIGQWHEWNHEGALDWPLLDVGTHSGLLQLLRDLNRLHREEPALHEQDFSHTGFEWIDFQDADSSVICFERFARDRRESIVIACNFTPVPRVGYRIGVREQGVYRELLNSDASMYSGSNMGNGGAVQSEPVPLHYRDHSIQLTLPPLAVLFLKHT
ncbi:MAG: 1,4-alpha-glucan branching protein GlgB [Ignavibacteria bacterium]|nr:1,4-alpha-glucan branching protein GlgB [Ignavibacteria bacterium]